MPANPNTYHTPEHSSGLKIGTGNGVADLYVPTGTTATTLALGNHTHSTYALKTDLPTISYNSGVITIE